MTEVIIEAATFLDLMIRAGRVAPTKGAAYDKASGIVMEVRPDETHNILVRSTNLDVYLMTWAKAFSIEGPPAVWRFHSETIQAIARALKVTGGARVTLKKDPAGNRVMINQGRLRSKVNIMIHLDYPFWKAFDPTFLQVSGNIQAALSKVEWAAGGSDADLLSAVKVVGDRLICTDRYRVATVPFEVPELGEPFLMKSKTLSTALTSQTHFKMGFEGDYMLIMPDDTTQIKVLGMAGEYVKIETIMIQKRPCELRVRRESLIGLVNRVLSVRGSDRSPLVRLIFGKGEIAGFMENEDFGLLGDVLEIPGYCDHPRIEYGFSHENLLACLTTAPGDDIIIGHDPGSLKKPFYLKGTDEFEAWLATRGNEKGS